MKKTYEFDKRILFLFIMSIMLKYSYAQLPFNNPVFDSVFVDRFDGGPYMDTAKWYSYYPWGLGNFYMSDTVTAKPNPNCEHIQDLANINPDPFINTNNRLINGGICSLIARNDSTTGRRWKYYPYPSDECDTLGLSHTSWDTTQCLREQFVPYKYSSGMLYSKKKFKYGYFKIRFRLIDWVADDSSQAYSLNFWMYDNKRNLFPHSEIDIFEIDCASGKYTNNVHVDATPDANNNITNDGYHYWEPNGEPFVELSQNPGTNDWHTATCYWSPDSITFSYDDGLEHRVAENPDTNQYLLPMPMIVDLGLEATNFCTNIDSLTQFPVNWEIDYIKVWQPKLACDSSKSYCNVTASTFTSKIYQNLTIGGSGCTASFNNGNASALGAEYVLLQEGFEIGNNMEMLIDVWPCWEGQTMEQTPNHPDPPPADFLKRKQLSGE